MQSNIIAHLGLAASILSLSMAPLPALAQGTGGLTLTPAGDVQKWNPKTNQWDPFAGGVAHQGDTYRAIEGGKLDCTFPGQKEHFTLSSCTAIRFVDLKLTPNGDTVYCKSFGQVEMWLPADRQALDDLKFETPVGLEVFGRTVPGSASDTHVVWQNPTAREVRVASKDGKSMLNPLSSIIGTVASINGDNGTFVVRDGSGHSTMVTLRPWSQLAKPRMNERVVNETPVQMVQQLKVGEPVVVYGVATAAQTGSGAFEPTTPSINFFASVVFPPGGQYIFGGTFVLSSPVTPTVGTGTVGGENTTMIQRAGDATPKLEPGVQLVNVACEIGNEAFIIPPPLPPAVIPSAGAIGTTPVYILLGAGAAAVLINSNNHNNNNNNFLPHRLPPASL